MVIQAVPPDNSSRARGYTERPWIRLRGQPIIVVMQSTNIGKLDLSFTKTHRAPLDGSCGDIPDHAANRS
jgi:hypothetical protein